MPGSIMMASFIPCISRRDQISNRHRVLPAKAYRSHPNPKMARWHSALRFTAFFSTVVFGFSLPRRRRTRPKPQAPPPAHRSGHAHRSYRPYHHFLIFLRDFAFSFHCTIIHLRAGPIFQRHSPCPRHYSQSDGIEHVLMKDFLPGPVLG